MSCFLIVETAWAQELVEYYGSLPRAVLSLYQALGLCCCCICIAIRELVMKKTSCHLRVAVSQWYVRDNSVRIGRAVDCEIQQHMSLKQHIGAIIRTTDCTVSVFLLFCTRLRWRRFPMHFTECCQRRGTSCALKLNMTLYEQCSAMLRP